MAKEFGVLPSAAARDLDEDPEQLSLVCLQMLRYAEAHAAFKSADKAVLKAWEGSSLMRQVEDNEFDLAREEM